MSKLLSCTSFFKIIVWLLLGSGLVCLTGCEEKKVPVSVGSYNHTNEGIVGYSVYDDKGNHAGGMMIEPGGGDHSNCCALIPKNWYPDLKVKVRWTILGDKEKNIPDTSHTAEVPIQKYYPSQTAVMDIHFYPDNTVKAVVTHFDVGNPFYPLSKEDQLPWKVDEAVLGNYLREGSQFMCDFQQSPDDMAWARQWTDKEFPKCTDERFAK